MASGPDVFPATLGTRERWSTAAAVLVGVVGLSAAGVLLTVATGDGRWLFLGLPFGLMLLVIGRYAPQRYRLAADGVHVERRARPLVIAYHAIRGVDRAPRRVAGFSMTGSRGVFGHFGRFWNSQLGFYRLQLTNRDAVVWLDTTDGWVALSPDRPDEFVERLTRARGGGTRGAGSSGGGTPGRG